MHSNSANLSYTDWSNRQRIIDRVQNHVCGHSTYSDMRTLLERNKPWDENTQKYLFQLVSNCMHCSATSTPPPNRRVFLASLSREINEVLCIDHFFLDSLTVFHCMDVATHFSAGSIVESTSMESAIHSIELIWFSQFWTPSFFQADGTFQNDQFKPFLKRYEIELRPVPPRRHCINPIDPRHGTIRSIFLRLKSAEPQKPDRLHTIRAIRISNDLYGSDTLSAFEMKKGFSKPLISSQRPIPVDEELHTAHDELIAKRKLTLIMRTNTFLSAQLKIGDLVQVFLHDGKSKRGSWNSPRNVLSINSEVRSITVPGRSGKVISADIENVRAHTENELASSIQKSIDQLEFNLCDTLHQQPDTDESNNQQPTTPNHDPPGDYSGANNIPVAGDRISVYWPLDEQYYSGTVDAIQPNGLHTIKYDDNDVETLDLSKDTWRNETSVFSMASKFVKTLASNEQ